MPDEPVHPLIQKLEALPAGQWRPRRPGNATALEAVERKFGLRLPDDYRALLLHSDGASIAASHTQINLDSIDTIETQDLDELVPERLPDMFVIGDDGAGNIYFYDPHNRQGRGEFAIFLVKMAVLDLAQAAFMAGTLTAMVDLAIAGERLRERL